MPKDYRDSRMPHNSIVAWLDGIGLGQFQAVFAEQQIAFEDLPDLSEQDLEKLSIPLGPRKRLMKAIAALHTPTAPERPTQPVPAHSGPEGERRQLTVLFCDMVGFTELATRVDPEVLQRIIRSYEDQCAVCITRYEGYAV